MTLEPWQKLELYIVGKLELIDINCKRTPGSGNKGRKGDIYTSCGLHIECKLRNTESVTIKKDVWKKLCDEVPFHSNNLPMLALENKEGKRWAVLELDDFLDIFIRLKTLEAHEEM